MLTRRKPCRINLLAIVAIALFGGFCGCAAAPFSDAEDTPIAAFNGPKPPSFSVEIKAGGSPVQRFERPHAGEVWLQDVVAQSGAPKRFRRMNIEVQRQVGEGEWAKMKAKIDPRTKKIAIDTDYAIRPGDRIVIAEDTSNALGGLLGPFLGTAGR